MGLLDYIEGLLPKPSDAEVEQVRRRIKALKSGNNAGDYGLLGPSPEQLAALRQQRGIPQAEPPSPWVSVGRGVTDLWEPMKQTYLNTTDPAQAQAYRQQRTEDERLYQRGMVYANPQHDYALQRDFWRQQGQQAPVLLSSAVGPLMSAPETVLSYGATQNLYDLLNALRKQFGIGE